uniref:Diacylglycerol kinase n=1 Tax=Castor canadensis TaxID=51338 RepID=A0A8B7VKG5_CASCN|nr:diacylglycerol kinase theta isoform X4 [Castor canadensis]
MAAAAEPGARAWPGDGSPRPGSPACSPVLGARGRARPGSGPERTGRTTGSAAPGHSFRKVTLTKPTFCHLCSDFIWGLAGFLCDVCNFMSHEKCLKQVKTPCTSVVPSLVRVPVAHCFGPRGLYKRKFCGVCRKGLEVPAFRCEATVASATRMGTRTMTPTSTTGGRGTCLLVHGVRSAGRRVAPQMCLLVCAASGVGSRPTQCAPLCLHPSAHLDACAPWCCLLPVCACCPATSAKCIASASLRPLARNQVMEKTAWMEVLPQALAERRWQLWTPVSASLSHHPIPICSNPLDSQLLPPGPGKQTLKIFDGNDTMRRNQFRLVTLPRLASSQEVLEVALRAYYISEDPQDFELQALPLPPLTGDAQAPGKAGSNGTTEEGSRGSGPREPTPEAWVIRALPRAQEVLKIYPGWLKVGVAYVSIRVTPQSTARAVVLEVLPLFGRQAEDPESFQLVEVLMGSRQVQRTVLADEEPLLDWLRDIRQTSVRQVSQTRFYVTESRTVAPHISLLVGGLPPGLSPQEYRNLLHEAMAIKAAVVSVSHVYPSQGAVVLDVTCFAEAERLYMLARDTAVHGRLLTALVLPDVLHLKLSPDCCPLLVFVNPKSGGLKGRDLLCSFRKLLNPHQVFELTNGGPLPGFHLFSQVPCFRVLVCGGDGTVGWVLATLEEMRHRLACPEPSVAILPLGTGNDLGRVLRWGAGYSGEDPFSVLVSVDEADAVLMDRWTILLDAQETGSAENSVVEAEPPKIVQMSNYCGIGIDAELSLDFHQAREEEPGKFTSRFHNKGVYVRVGLQKISHSRSLHKEIRLQVEQQEVELPSIEGLIFINIPSWGSGADLWGSDSDAKFEKPRMDDGLLEVVGVTGVVHMVSTGGLVGVPLWCLMGPTKLIFPPA